MYRIRQSSIISRLTEVNSLSLLLGSKLKYFFTIPLVTLTLLALGQQKSLSPQIIDFPNLNPDSLALFTEKQNEYFKISKQQISFESLTQAQKELLYDEMLYEAGPYHTEPLGCSWYCAGSPSSFKASSELQPSQAASYDAKNVHDFDLRTAWVEGKENYGIGESISIDIPLGSLLKVTHIEVYNGYCKSEKVWADNSRVKLLAVYENGEFLANLNLVDTYKKQRFEIGSLEGGTDDILHLKFQILQVYPGNKYQDTAISEINFDGTGDH